MVDPLDDLFETGRRIGFEPDDEPIDEDNPDGMSPIEAAAIAGDVDMVRRELKAAITETAKSIPDIVALASQMQDPAMFDSASKMIATLGKLSTDLIGIDLKVLQESKKTKAPATMVPGTTAQGVQGSPAQPQREMTTADVLRLIREAEEDAESDVSSNADSQPAP